MPEKAQAAVARTMVARPQAAAEEPAGLVPVAGVPPAEREGARSPDQAGAKRERQ